VRRTKRHNKAEQKEVKRLRTLNSPETHAKIFRKALTMMPKLDGVLPLPFKIVTNLSLEDFDTITSEHPASLSRALFYDAGNVVVEEYPLHPAHESVINLVGESVRAAVVGAIGGGVGAMGGHNVHFGNSSFQPDASFRPLNSGKLENTRICH
jgi:hypothetical protein